MKNIKISINLKRGFSFYDIGNELASKDCIISVEVSIDELKQAIRCFMNWNMLFPPRGEVGEKMKEYYPDYLL